MAIYLGTAMEILWQVGMVAVLRKMYGLMCRRTRGSPPTGFGCTGEVCTTLNVRKGNAHHRRGWQIWMVEVPKTQLNISQKELTSLLQTTSRFNIKRMVNIYPKEGRSRRHKYPVRSLDLHTQPSYYEPLFRHGKLSSPTTPSTILVFVVRCKLKDNNPLMILT